MKLDPLHPKQELFFFVEGDVDDTIAKDMRDLITSLTQQRNWTIGPPRFVNEVDSPKQSDVDQPLRTVGVTLELFSALRTKSEIAFELDGVQVGWIEDGVPCRALGEAFLGEWERSLLAVPPQ
jgi:hypothetical protein